MRCRRPYVHACMHTRTRECVTDVLTRRLTRRLARARFSAMILLCAGLLPRLVSGVECRCSSRGAAKQLRSGVGSDLVTTRFLWEFGRRGCLWRVSYTGPLGLGAPGSDTGL